MTFTTTCFKQNDKIDNDCKLFPTQAYYTFKASHADLLLFEWKVYVYRKTTYRHYTLVAMPLLILSRMLNLKQKLLKIMARRNIVTITNAETSQWEYLEREATALQLDKIDRFDKVDPHQTTIKFTPFQKYIWRFPSHSV